VTLRSRAGPDITIIIIEEADCFGCWILFPGLSFSRLLKNSQNVIARSVFRDVAISKLLVSLKPRFLRFARKDGKKTFSATC